MHHIFISHISSEHCEDHHIMYQISALYNMSETEQGKHI